jgi:hypothetical protein
MVLVVSKAQGTEMGVFFRSYLARLRALVVHYFAKKMGPFRGKMSRKEAKAEYSFHITLQRMYMNLEFLFIICFSLRLIFDHCEVDKEGIFTAPQSFQLI